MIKATGKAFLLSIAGPVILSFFDAVYFGYRHSAYSFVVLGALICTAYFLWSARQSFRFAFSDREPNTPRWHMPTQILAIFLMTFAAFLLADSIVYFLARSLTGTVPISN